MTDARRTTSAPLPLAGPTYSLVLTTPCCFSPPQTFQHKFVCQEFESNEEGDVNT